MLDINDFFGVLALVIGCVITVFVGVLEIFILIFIWEGTWNLNPEKPRGINLNMLISERTGDASLSRFQLLIFTFVIAMSLVLIITSNKPPAFPTSIPDQILGLLGISSTSYVLGKAIQTQIKDSPTEPPPTPSEQHSNPE